MKRGVNKLSTTAGIILAVISTLLWLAALSAPWWHLATPYKVGGAAAILIVSEPMAILAAGLLGFGNREKIMSYLMRRKKSR